MHVFLSVASPERKQAEEVALALRGAGHVVFLDEHELPVAESYHERIRQAIARADIMVFFVSPASVSPKRYTLSELKFAQAKWPHPRGRVLPVMASRTPMQAIPPYLRAVSICMPKGDLAAEVAFEVDRLAAAMRTGSWWNLGSGVSVGVGSGRLPPLVPTVALAAGLGLIGGLVTFALQRLGMSDYSMWIVSSIMRGALFGAILCFLLFYIELGEFRALAVAMLGSILAFFVSDYLMRSLGLFNGWDVTSRMVLWSIIRVSIIVLALCFVFAEFKDMRRWGIIVGAAVLSRLFHGSLRDARSTEFAVSWAIWDASVLAALCYVLWTIAAQRQQNVGQSGDRIAAWGVRHDRKGRV